MAEGTCSINGCDRTLYARGWCHRHYNQWYHDTDRREVRPYGGADGLCSVEDCGRPVFVLSRGWCNPHYRRWQRVGDPTKALFEHGDPVANFWRKVQRGSDAECWPWTGHISGQGYGKFVWPGGQLAHRFAYELLVGPIPDGLTLDHTCHTTDPACMATGHGCAHRRCVNPAHLEPVTRRENLRRAWIRAVADS